MISPPDARPALLGNYGPGFTLHKGAFQDALALRYGWLPSNLPSHCACGTHFRVEHSLSCSKGGLPSIRHNEVRDAVSSWLSEVCNDVCVEPHLQPLSGEVLTGASANTEEGARLDIAANGFWGGRFERAYFDVRVFLRRIDNSLYLPPTGLMKGLRFVPMSNVFVRWNMAPSPPLSCLSLVGLDLLPQPVLKDWLHCCPRNGTSLIAPLLPGRDASSPLPSCSPQSSVFGVPALLLVVLPGMCCYLWTLSLQRLALTFEF